MTCTDGSPWRGLYAITPDLNDAQQLRALLLPALRGGVRWLQFRNKILGRNERLEMGQAVAQCCREWGVKLVVNDDLELACQLGAHALHWGENDLPQTQESLDYVSIVESKRSQTQPGLERFAAPGGGKGIAVGISCYDSLELAQQAQDRGAAYVAFGSFFPSFTKPAARRASPALLRSARKLLQVPIVAIGGITLDNAEQLLAEGADGLAVSAGLFATADVEATARRFLSYFPSVQTS